MRTDPGRGLPPRDRPSRVRRAVRLLVAAGAGAALAALGQAWSGDDAWWLLLPAAVALAWWPVADPGSCRAPPR